MSPLQSPLPKTSEDCADFAEEEKHTQVTKSEDENEEKTDEDEDGTDCRRDDRSDDDDEEDDEDYEEVVVKPRHLNEITSLTDKTSPWTSILSEPDLVALESLEAPEEPDLSRGKDKNRQVVNLEKLESSGTHECARQEEYDSLTGSTGDVSDTDREDERTLEALDQRQAKRSHSPHKESGDNCPSPTQRITDTPDAPLEDPQLQPYP